MGVAASSASAKDVWLWACQGPTGQAITSPLSQQTTPGAQVGSQSGGCATLRFDAGAAANGAAERTINLPAGITVQQLRLFRTTSGFSGAVNTVKYSLDLGGREIETRSGGQADLAATGEAISVPGGASGNLTFRLSCTDCATTASVDVVKVAILAKDESAPSGSVGWNSPVDHEMKVTPSYSDSGTGLDRAELTLDGVSRAPSVVKFGSGDGCAELSPGDATNDRPLDVEACPTGLSQGEGKAVLPIGKALQVWKDTPEKDAQGRETGKWIEDPLRLPEGLFTWRVTVYDAAGNTATYSNGVEVWHPPTPSATQTLSISTSGVTEQPSPNNPGANPPGGGVQGGQASQCRTPRLSVTLRSKPVRVSKGTPVLRYKKSYRFTGRLTCVINGKRQSAPKRTKVSILNKVGKKTVRKPNTAIRSKGAVDLKLAFVSSRTVIFRYTNASGQKSEVKIKVRITKKKK